MDNIERVACNTCGDDLTFRDDWSRWDDTYYCFTCLPPDEA